MPWSVAEIAPLLIQGLLSGDVIMDNALLREVYVIVTLTVLINQMKCHVKTCRNLSEPVPGDNGQCISETKVCDEKYDCPNEDKSDENSTVCNHWNCTGDRWKCANGICIDRDQVCDGVAACNDGSDEGLHCKDWTCLPGYIKCLDNLQCVSNKSLCNGKAHCIDGSDEHKHICNTCGDDNWLCFDGEQCVSCADVCNNVPDCNDGSDELEYVCDTYQCPPGMWFCNDKRKCILTSQRCDGKIECSDGSDENLCEDYVCPIGATKCANQIQCIDKSMICDNYIDCLDGSDELCTALCLAKPITQKTIVRKCIEDSSVCFPIDKICDGVADCPDGSDEADCGCEDWDMHICQIDDHPMCAYKEWFQGTMRETNHCLLRGPVREPSPDTSFKGRKLS